MGESATKMQRPIDSFFRIALLSLGANIDNSGISDVVEEIDCNCLDRDLLRRGSL